MIFEQCEDGWWTGELGGKYGVFPYNYVKVNGKIETKSEKESQASQPKKFLPNKDGITKSGFLTKKGHRRRNWQVRYFVLKGNVLSYFCAPGDSKPKGSVELKSSSIIGPAAGMKRAFAFQITTCKKPYIFFMAAQTKDEMDDWIDALKEAKG
eukprot:TRINITY_DN9867_c0_g1_i2.p1 TRINITY_DN9867_c0_g1~~TRINITY_DN9867_c0_g1_i2.p1  ORF type:complete len:153 (-),score=29.10 TRINITY_DN9867_c0_g1_i2:135-593(-)